MVRIYTLNNGELLIGEEKESWDKNCICISNPYYITEVSDEYGNNGLKLINVCTFSDQQYIVVNNNHVVYSIPANKTMSKYYNKLVESIKPDTTRIIEEAIRDMEEMEDNMRDIIAQRLVGGSTIN